MKLEKMTVVDLRELERMLGHLLMDEADILMSELQDKILEILEKKVSA